MMKGDAMTYDQILDEILRQLDFILMYSAIKESRAVVYLDSNSLKTLMEGNSFDVVNYNLKTVFGMRVYEVKTEMTHINVAEYC